MKWMIASDLHGAAPCVERLLRRFEEEKADKLLLLGDLLYHGARNALPEQYGTLAVAKLLNGVKDRLLCVRGNCDSEVDQMVLEFPITAEHAILTEAGKTIFATHGHRYSSDFLPPLGGVDVLLQGHTHVPMCEVREGCLCLNPGSVGIPKGTSENSYMTLENGVFTWKTLEGKAYCAYSLIEGKPLDI